MHRGSRRYEVGVVAILCLVYTVVNFEFLGINYLLPFVVPALRLTNGELGAVVSAFWIPFGFSSYLTGRLADKWGSRQSTLVVVLLLFSFCSVLSGLAASFHELLAARSLMGLIEGPVLPLAQSIVAMESAEARRGTNMGIVQTLGAGVMSGFIAPLALVQWAVHHGWRTGFFMVAVPGLISAALVAAFIREPTPGGRPDDADVRATADSYGHILRARNVWLCSVLSVMFVAHSLIGLGYLPVFLVRERHLPPQQMSMLMSVLGISSIVLGVLVPAIADRMGRKPTAIVAGMLGALCPLAALYCSASLGVLGMLMFLGWAPVGASILYMSTIPSESVPAGSISAAIGLTFAVGTLVGGGFGPALSGWAADHWGLRITLVIEACIAVCMGALATGLRETMKRKPLAA
jgi:MFS family permease